MASIRRRVLADGTERFDVHHHLDGNKTTTTFVCPDEADGFARACNLRRKRWPLAPLVARSGLGARELARLVGHRSHNLSNLAKHGLTDVQADHWATAAGLHPVQVWGWDWVTAIHPDTGAVDDGEAVA